MRTAAVGLPLPQSSPAYKTWLAQKDLQILHRNELSDALGISIAGGKGSPLGDIPIFIAMIQANGVAARTQKLKVGDRIVSINGQPLDGLSHTDAVNLLKNAFGRIILQVVADTNISAIATQLEIMSAGSQLGSPTADRHPEDTEEQMQRTAD